MHHGKCGRWRNALPVTCSPCSHNLRYKSSKRYACSLTHSLIPFGVRLINKTFIFFTEQMRCNSRGSHKEKTTTIHATDKLTDSTFSKLIWLLFYAQIPWWEIYYLWCGLLWKKFQKQFTYDCGLITKTPVSPLTRITPYHCHVYSFCA